MNLWQVIEPGTKDSMNVIVEIPRGSSNKYEVDEEKGIMYLDRVNYSAAAYPCEYGFIPQTSWDDGKAIDVLILSTHPIHPGILVEVRPVALMEMIDTGENDFKIIGVPVNDKRWDDVQDLSDLNRHTIRELKHFFETYKCLKGSQDNEHKVVIEGFKGKKEAQAAFERACKMYTDKQ